MADLMRVRTVFAYGAGSPGLMTQYFGNELRSYNDADAQVAVDRVRDALNTLPVLWPTSFSWLIQGGVDVLNDETGEVTSHHGVTDRTGVGTHTGGLGPLPVGVLLRSLTSTYIGGHRLSGRTFLAPVASQYTSTPTVQADITAGVIGIGDALLAAGLTLIFPYVWSRPRPATAVGPHRPAGAARSPRAGSSARVTSYTSPPEFVVLRSRRD